MSNDQTPPSRPPGFNPLDPLKVNRPMPTPDEFTRLMLQTRVAVLWVLFLTVVNAGMLAYDTRAVYVVEQFVSKL